ncbi:hypothetical protein [Kutzneria buriramensis]|uniref:Uncharacterized protein n=1 Tax=Kutzneria buriramensis TaxID=1045776 RepID=A0A3E0G3S0_9PSEU|nr:hypothetical protein [Kutzneria buriramensis]REH17434.1 hypothetical protein BCF44_1476 [Kutzneria buriramensis]
MAGKVGVTGKVSDEVKAARCGMTLEQWRKAQQGVKTNKTRGRRATGEGVDFSTPVAGQLDMFAG